MKYCSKCGSKLGEGNRCAKCGEEISSPSNFPWYDYVQAPLVKDFSKYKKKRQIKSSIRWVIFLCLVFDILLLSFVPTDDSKTSTSVKNDVELTFKENANQEQDTPTAAEENDTGSDYSFSSAQNDPGILDKIFQTAEPVPEDNDVSEINLETADSATVVTDPAQNRELNLDYNEYSLIEFSFENKDQYGFYLKEDSGLIYQITGDFATIVNCTEDGKIMQRHTPLSEIDGVKVTQIGAYAFSGCDKIQKVIIPETIETIGYSAFRGTGIAYLDIPDSVNYVADYAFADCKSLISVNFGKNVSIVGNFIFENDTSLFQLRLRKNPQDFISFGEHALDGMKAQVSY